jgi:multicomponent Na+:H+ antiporter subunit F
VTASIVTVVVVASLLSMALAIARVLRGPTQADRVVALDVVFSCSVALTAAAAVVEGSPLFLDVAIGLALVDGDA